MSVSGRCPVRAGVRRVGVCVRRSQGGWVSVSDPKRMGVCVRSGGGWVSVSGRLCPVEDGCLCPVVSVTVRQGLE